MKSDPHNYQLIFEHGTLPLLMYSNRQDAGGKKIERPIHSHSSLCEFALCYTGSGYYNVDHESYPVRQSDVIYCNVGERHEVISDTDTQIGLFALGFTNVHLKELPENYLIPSDSPHLRPAGAHFTFLHQLCDKILELDPRIPMQKVLQQNVALTFMLTALSIPADQKRSQITDAASSVTSLVKDYINAHYTEDIHLSDIAHQFSFSTPYISHTFKSTTGYSPIQYLIRCRIGQAQTLLISSDLSVTEVAMCVGYDNSSHFQTLFKQVVGITPLQYRKKYLETLHGERDQR